MRRFLTLSIAVMAFMPFALSSCSSDDDGGEGGGEKQRNGVISGVAQKGQFLKGSSVTIYALDKTLSASGLSYPTQTTDDMGSFTITNVNADYIDIKANGYYYNENRQRTSESTINLQAVSSANSKVNVNLLTTLAYNRIKYLVANGSSFADAQSRAQIEVLTALGLGNSTSANFIDMNISGAGDANGLLLAASLLIQERRSVGDVSKLISDIAADLEEDGLLSAKLNEEIHYNESSIDVGEVILGLIEFYEKNKVDDFSIPTFYKFLDTNGDGKMDGQAEFFKNIDNAESSYYDPYNPNRGYDAAGFTRTEHFISTIPFNVKSDAAWLSVEKKTIAENIYAIDIVAQPNTTENRTAHVIYTDNSGKELWTSTYQQKVPDEMVPQRFMVETYGYEYKYLIKDKVGVNGKVYDFKELDNSDYYYSDRSSRYFDIPYTDKTSTYQCYFPVNMISMPNGIGSYTLTIPTSLTTDDFPFVALRNDAYGPISNPTSIGFTQACPAIMVEGDFETIDHIVLTTDQPICGTATYDFQDGYLNYEPQIDESRTKPNSDGVYQMTVKVNYHENVWRICIPVLKSNCPVDVAYYNANGDLLESVTRYSDLYGWGFGGQTR